MNLAEFLTETYFNNTIMQYLMFFTAVSVSIVLGKIIHFVSTRTIRIFTKNTKTKLDDVIIQSTEKPFIFAIFIAGLFYGSKQLILNDWWINLFVHLINILIIMDVAWFLISFIDKIMVVYIKPLSERTDNDLDDHLIPIVRKLIKFSLIIITLILIISNMGYDVTTLVTGVGIGGIAIAFAAQEMLKNLFGGIAIITDKPFRMGEWVQFGNTEGSVEEIGIRSTKLKTVEGKLVTIPNHMINNAEVTNYNRYDYRKKIFIIGLTYDTTAAKIEKAKELIRNIIMKTDHVVKDTIEVNFKEFNSYSLDVEVRFNFDTNSISVIRPTMDRVNLEIKRQFEKTGINMAFPTQTIELKR